MRKSLIAAALVAASLVAASGAQATGTTAPIQAVSVAPAFRFGGLTLGQPVPAALTQGSVDLDSAALFNKPLPNVRVLAVTLTLGDTKQHNNALLILIDNRVEAIEAHDAAANPGDMFRMIEGNLAHRPSVNVIGEAFWNVGSQHVVAADLTLIAYTDRYAALYAANGGGAALR